jgi:hypothetical protein
MIKKTMRKTPSQCNAYVCIECLPQLRVCNQKKKKKEEKQNMAPMPLLSRVRQRMPFFMIVKAVVDPTVGTLSLATNEPTQGSGMMR